MAWSYPIHAASAFRQENQIDTTFINYEQFHNTTVGHIEGSQTDESDTDKNRPLSKPRPVINDAPKIPYNGRHYSKEEVIGLITQYSQQFGIQADAPLCIARLESGYNQFSKNKSSSASGVFQYLISTWNKTDEGRSGLSVFDADSNVKAAVKYMAIHKSTRPWTVAHQCPSLTFLK